jgi:ribonuclease HI
MGGKTSNESKAKYNAKAYDRINIAVPKGRKAELQAVAGEYGQSVNSYINRLIDEAMEREKAEAGAVSVFQPLPGE